MNSLFCSDGNNLAKKIPQAPNYLLKGQYIIIKNQSNFHFTTICIQDVSDAIAKLKTATSFGNDNISCYFLKLALPVIEKYLAFLFNSPIDTNQFPSNWKVARVTPIFKEGDKTNKSNYRPISVLSVISRVFEKLIANKLCQYFGDNDLFILASLDLENFIPLWLVSSKTLMTGTVSWMLESLWV